MLRATRRPRDRVEAGEGHGCTEARRGDVRPRMKGVTMKHMKTRIAMTAVGATAAFVLAFAADRPQPRSAEFRLVAIPESAVHHRATHDPRIRNEANGTSTNWGGYAVPASRGAVSDVKGSWTVPTVVSSTSSSTYSSFWVGIDGYNDSTVEQTGTEQDWSNGQASYYAWFEMYPKFAYKILNFPVVPGDTITSEVQYLGSGRYALTITNVSRNVTFSTTQRLKNAGNQSAEWIAEAPYSGGVLPLADFGTGYFSNCTATLNGVTGGIGTWPNYDAITMTTSGGVTKAAPSGLTNGTDFSVIWSHE